MWKTIFFEKVQSSLWEKNEIRLLQLFGRNPTWKISNLVGFWHLKKNENIFESFATAYVFYRTIMFFVWEKLCDGTAGDVRCACEERFVKNFTLVEKSRRKLAIMGEEMFCENVNSCLVEKESEDGMFMAGPLGSLWECYDMSTDSFYPITSYNTRNNNTDLDIQEKVYCTDYTVTCVPEISNISLLRNFLDSCI